MICNLSLAQTIGYQPEAACSSVHSMSQQDVLSTLSWSGAEAGVCTCVHALKVVGNSVCWKSAQVSAIQPFITQACGATA